MPRINIEDSLFRDRRFINLVIKLGCPETAVGALVLAWSIAQKWYLSPNQSIPIEEWKTQNLKDEIIDVGLAVVDGRFVRMKGADDQFKWLKQRSDAGRKNIGEFNKRSLTAVDGRTSSSSFSNKKEEYIVESAIQRESLDFEKLYQKYPRKDGKTPGKKIFDREIKTKEDFDKLERSVSNFSRQMSQEKREKKHILMFSTFMGRWRDYLDPQNAIRGPQTGLPVEYSADDPLGDLAIEKLLKGEL